MTTQTQNDTTADPVNDQLRHLAAARLPTRRIAELLNLSQSTVVRRLRDIRNAEDAERIRRRWLTVMFALLTVSAVTIAAAVATMAW